MARIPDREDGAVAPLRVITLVVLVLLIVGGWLGGVAFLIAPDGGAMGMTVDELPEWPLLGDYTVPGIALIVLFGLLPVAAVVLLVRHRALGWTATTAVGLVLVACTLGQIVAIGLPFLAIQAGFLAVGIVLTGLGVDGGASVGTSDESRRALRS
jgi:hypothetical protein